MDFIDIYNLVKNYKKSSIKYDVILSELQILFKNQVDSLKSSDSTDSDEEILESLKGYLYHSYNKLLELNKGDIYKIQIYEIIIDIIRGYIEEMLSNRDAGYYLYNLDPLKMGNNISPDIMKYYPDILDNDFIDKLIMKYEFISNQMEEPEEPKKKKKIKLKGFKKSPNQRFVKNFISPDTPYNGILLWHEVGVGKTCAAIGIAENFKDRIYVDNKIIILTPSDTLKNSWYDSIYNITAELENLKESYNKQCTGDNYSRKNIIRLGETDADIVKIRRRRNKEIEKYYELMGYQKFANVFEKNRDKFFEDVPKKNSYYKNMIEFIKKTYSNRVIICDEIQYTRENNKIKLEDDIDGNIQVSGKKIRVCLELVCRYAVNTKLILLSATPMYDVTKEIIWLMNLLLLNDKRSKMDSTEYFSKDGLYIKADKKDKFMRKIKGYISYVRGDNPFIYPVKLWPSIEHKDRGNLYIPHNIDCLIRSGFSNITELYKDLSDKDVIFEEIALHATNKTKRWMKSAAKAISTGEAIDDLVLYKNYMSEWQYDSYKTITKNNKSGYNIAPRQSSNIIFPSTDDIDAISNSSGDSAFNKLFTKQQGKYKLKSLFIDTTAQTSIFTVNDKVPNSLHKFSIKFNNIVKLITDSKGICFVYSQFKKYGAEILSIILEANGFERFNCDTKGNILENQNLSINELDIEIKNKYILLTGSTPKNVLDKLKNYVNSPDNKDGGEIKVIIGTRAIEQGLSFFNIRQLHVLEPWYHLNSVNQVIGRAVRRNSHKELPEKESNVTIYLHISLPPKKIKIKGTSNTKLIRRQKPLIDEKMYVMSLNKYKGILETQRLIKKSAIDCNLNIKGNILNLNDIIDRTDSFGEKRKVFLGDINGSMRCDFTSCNYKCNTNKDLSSINPSDIDTDTYNINLLEDEIIFIKEVIKNIFKESYASDIEKISRETLTEDINSFIKTMKADSILGDRTTEYVDGIIYKAIDRIIDNKETIYNNDKSGFLEKFKQDGKMYYVFQPTTLNDTYIPIKYKYLKLKSIKKDFYIEDIQASKIPKKTKSIDWSDELPDMLKKAIYSVMYRYPKDFIPYKDDNMNDKIPAEVIKEFKDTLKLKIHKTPTIYSKHPTKLPTYKDFIRNELLTHIEDHYKTKVELLKYIFSRKSIYNKNVASYVQEDFVTELSSGLDDQEENLLKDSINIIFDSYFSNKDFKFSYFVTNKQFHESLKYRRGASKVKKKRNGDGDSEPHNIKYLIIPNVKYIKITKKKSETVAVQSDLFRYFMFKIKGKPSLENIEKFTLAKTNKSTDYFDDTFFPKIEPDMSRNEVYTSPLYGFLEENDTNKIKFKIVDNLNIRRRQLTKGAKISARDERKGNACGTAGGKRGKKEVIFDTFIKTMIGYLGVNMGAADITSYKKTYTKPSLCFEIRLLMRYLEYKGFQKSSKPIKELTKKYRYLYKKEIKDKIELTLMAFSM